MKAVDGRGRSQGRNLRWNFIAGHSVTEGKLRGLSGSLAFRYRSAPNLGYGLKTLPDGTVSFDLGKPVGIEQGLRFAIREGGRTVGAGLVTDVIA